MNIEDLKVGMVFTDIRKCYYKIDKITKRNIYFYVLWPCGGEMRIFQCDKENLIKDYELKLIDKVLPKIVEVEEEVPVYIPNINYDPLMKCGSVSGGPYPQITILELYKNNENYVELCKIKKIVKKELNFSWESGEWK